MVFRVIFGPECVPIPVRTRVVPSPLTWTYPAGAVIPFVTNIQPKTSIEPGTARDRVGHENLAALLVELLRE